MLNVEESIHKRCLRDNETNLSRHSQCVAKTDRLLWKVFRIHNPHPQLSLLDFRINAEWGRMEAILPTIWQEDTSALILLWEIVPWMFGPLEPQQWTLLHEHNFFFPLILHVVCLSLWPKHYCLHGWTGHGHGLTQALSTLNRRAHSYWWYVPGLSKEPARNHRNFHTVPCPSVRIYYTLAHKPHKGWKWFIYSSKK